MFDFSDFSFDDSASVEQSTALYIPEASDCMRCGMCVSTCPTFRIDNTQEETPRSRVRTISKLLNEQTISAEEQTHLLNCVQCRACEPACPSQMAYGRLFDQALIQLAGKPTTWAKIGLWFIEEKIWRKRLLPVLSWYCQSGLRKPLQASGVLHRLSLASAEALLTPPALTSLASFYPSKIASKGKVALFTGCLTEHFDQLTLLATIKIVNAIGYDVILPEQQTCCGAIHQHNGLSASHLIAQNINVFNALDVDAVLYTATGCGSMLTEYQTDDEQANQQFSERLQDAQQFILAHWPEHITVRALPLSVAVHEPCSQRNVLKNQQAVYQLLAKIPELSCMPLTDNATCCGAGGSYMLSHPEKAQQLRDIKRQHIKDINVDRIVSSNYSCGLFLQTANDKIYHPLVLLAEQL